MPKKVLSNLSAVVVPFFRTANGIFIMLDKKDNGHPIVHIRGKLCPIGGNWVGKNAVLDENPKMTAVREWQEEITLEKFEDSVCLGQMTVAPLDDKRTPENIFKDDQESLKSITNYVIDHLTPCGDYINHTPKEVYDRDDPSNKRNGFTTLTSYYVCELSKFDWKELMRLLAAYGNLSNESETVILSYDEIINDKIYCAFGHDTFLADFFKEQGFDVTNFPRVKDIVGLKTKHDTLNNYSKYLSLYEINTKP